jgi:hypothetical protein
MHSLPPEFETTHTPRPDDESGTHPETPPFGGLRGANRGGDPKAARKADNLVEILAADLVAVFSTRAPDVDIVKLGLTIAEAGRRLEAGAA